MIILKKVEKKGEGEEGLKAKGRRNRMKRRRRLQRGNFARRTKRIPSPHHSIDVRRAAKEASIVLEREEPLVGVEDEEEMDVEMMQKLSRMVKHQQKAMGSPTGAGDAPAGLPGFPDLPLLPPPPPMFCPPILRELHKLQTLLRLHPALLMRAAQNEEEEAGREDQEPQQPREDEDGDEILEIPEDTGVNDPEDLEAVGEMSGLHGLGAERPRSRASGGAASRREEREREEGRERERERAGFGRKRALSPPMPPMMPPEFNFDKLPLPMPLKTIEVGDRFVSSLIR